MVKGNVPCAVIVDAAHAVMLPQMLKEKPIKVADAQTRRRKDKDKIDAFITESVGFAPVTRPCDPIDPHLCVPLTPSTPAPTAR